MSIVIRPIRVRDCGGLRLAVDSVAREGKYLSLTKGFTPEATRAFVSGIIKRGDPQFVALDGDKVAGWCDIIPRDRPSMRHVGVLGIGILPAYRDRGIGTALMTRTLEAARRRKMRKIELEVLADNKRAIALYRKLGFVREGRKLKAARLGGRYRDMVLMGYFFR
jgi:ribosomal protein S18 acetylase RimI-like enzyme